jgi:hypothetical protein
MAAIPRTTRDGDSRQSLEERKLLLANQLQDGGIKNLPDFPPRENMEQRWINGADKVRLQQAMASLYWEPRPAETIPNHDLLTNMDLGGINAIVINDMVLMERHKDLCDIERASQRQRTDLQIEAIKRDPFKDVSDVDRRYAVPTKDRITTRRETIAPIIDE